MKSGSDLEINGGWRRAWSESFRRSEDLLEFLGLNPLESPVPITNQKEFPLLVPRSFARRMRRGDWKDPLLRQVLSLSLEGERHPGYSADPVQDSAAEVVPGLLRKYQGRALLILTGACAVHCRYCFRREFPYTEGPTSSETWMGIYARLEKDSEIEEIIFSGGDPLSLSDEKLRWHASFALALPRVRRLRIHTRLPIVLPERVDQSFLRTVADWSEIKPVYLVLHANHAQELDAGVVTALKSLRSAGAILLNQSVLLRGINDTVEALTELSGRLTDAGVLPYYLHQLDRIRGAQHFEVPEEEGLALLAELKNQVPGYFVPRYVREIPGQASKTGIIGGIPENLSLTYGQPNDRSGAALPSPIFLQNFSAPKS